MPADTDDARGRRQSWTNTDESASRLREVKVTGVTDAAKRGLAFDRTTGTLTAYVIPLPGRPE
jgi:hypothetical protein